MDKTTKKPDVPAIRFKGFTDAWEQRTVGVFYDFKNGLNKGKAFFGHGTPIVNFTDVFHNRSLYCKDLCGRVSLSREEINNFNVHKGDLFFTRTSETIEEIGYSSVMMEEPESTVFSGFVLRGRAVDDDPLENIFKSYVFFTDTFRKEMIMKSSMTTRALTSGTAIKKMLFYYPSDKTEQKRIGSLLEHLDRLITLHQRKLDKLHNVKKSLLEKMFPRNGADVPEIRFSGFTYAWEQRKVTKLGEIYIGLVTTMTSHYTDHGALLIRNSDIKDSRFEFGTEPIYLDDDFAKQNASRQHKVGDVITVHTGDIGTSAVITEKEANSIGFATIVTRPYKDIITSDYLCTYLNTDTHKNFAMNISTGDGRNNYNLKDYYECVVPVPCIEEQKRISEFIKNLNNLITLHQRKLEKLRQIKKSLLEKMFV